SVTGVEASEVSRLVLPRFPPDSGKIGRVGDAEVLKGSEELAVERVPETHVERGATIGPAPNVEPVRSFGRRSEREQYARLQVVKEAPIRGGLGMMELVDDDDIEHLCVDARRIVGVQ